MKFVVIGLCGILDIMEMEQTYNRILYLDIAKAICIILVVIGHYIPDNSPIWYVMIHDVIYTFHMPLFMFASGYVYIATRKEIKYRDFVVKKIKRLMVPYFSTSLIIIVIKLITQGNLSVENPVSMFSFVEMFYVPVAGYFLWFIWALLWMFVLLPLFKSTKSHNILFLLSIVLHYVPIPLTEVFCISQFKAMLLFFMLGIFVYENKLVNRFIISYHHYKFILASVLFVFAEIIFLRNQNSGGNMLTTIFLPFIGILFIIEVSKLISINWKEDRIKNKWLMQIAYSSYTIYLFHTTFEGFAKAMVRKLPLDADRWWIFVIETIIVIMVGVITPIIIQRHILKKYKLTKMLFGL